jgi:hypothetical protein
MGASRAANRNMGTDACFIARDANRQALAYIYFEDEAGRKAAAFSLKTTPNGSALARLQKLLQRLIPYLTGFFPGAKLTARLFHGKANSFAVNFPGVSFWWRAAMFYVHPKFSI